VKTSFLKPLCFFKTRKFCRLRLGGQDAGGGVQAAARGAGGKGRYTLHAVDPSRLGTAWFLYNPRTYEVKTWFSQALICFFHKFNNLYRYASGGFVTAGEWIEMRKDNINIKTGSDSLDVILGGGVPTVGACTS
jgi:hypothetical protein